MLKEDGGERLPSVGVGLVLEEDGGVFLGDGETVGRRFPNGFLGAGNVAFLFDIRLDHALGEGDGVNGGLSALQVIPIGISGRLVDSLVRMVEFEQESLGVEEGVIQQGLVSRQRSLSAKAS